MIIVIKELQVYIHMTSSPVNRIFHIEMAIDVLFCSSSSSSSKVAKSEPFPTLLIIIDELTKFSTPLLHYILCFVRSKDFAAVILEGKYKSTQCQVSIFWGRATTSSSVESAAVPTVGAVVKVVDIT